MPSSAADPSMGAVKTPQQVLRLRWNADGNEEEDEECTVPIARLRQHCSSETARSLRRRFGTSTDVAHPNSTPVLWGEGVFSSATGKSPPSFEYKDIMEDDQQPLPASSSSSSQTAASRLLGVLKSHGIALVRGSPANVAGTEALGRKIGGHLMGTYYGKESWSVSTETVDTDYSCRDAAYTTKAIGLHTDCVFLAEPPGIQVKQNRVDYYGGLCSTVLVPRMFTLGSPSRCQKHCLRCSNRWGGQVPHVRMVASSKHGHLA